MKKILTILFAVALCVAALAVTATGPLDFPQATPINASLYLSGATAVKTIRVLSIDYQNGVARFQLLDAGGAPYGSATCGLDAADVREGNVEAKIISLITRT